MGAALGLMRESPVKASQVEEILPASQHSPLLSCGICGILTNVDSDEPVQTPLRLRNSKWCSFSSLTVIEYSSDLQRL